MSISAGTSDYYRDHAQDYFDRTIHLDMSDLYDTFLKFIPPGGRILDAGSGSGRDTLAFLKRGYAVEAFDASPALAERSTRLTGVQTRVETFGDFAGRADFDGVWACASLLHVPRAKLHDALAGLSAALKVRGAMYMSAKHGREDRLCDDGRHFVDLTEAQLRLVFASLPDLVLRKIWITDGRDPTRPADCWINAIATKGHPED